MANIGEIGWGWGGGGGVKEMRQEGQGNGEMEMWSTMQEWEEGADRRWVISS